MRTFAIIAAAFASTALAAPGGWGNWKNGGGKPAACLTDAQTDSIVSQYSYLLINPQGADFNATAASLLAPDFAVYSDSINTLASRPVSPNPSNNLTRGSCY